MKPSIHRRGTLFKFFLLRALEKAEAIFIRFLCVLNKHEDAGPVTLPVELTQKLLELKEEFRNFDNYWLTTAPSGFRRGSNLLDDATIEERDRVFRMLHDANPSYVIMCPHCKKMGGNWLKNLNHAIKLKPKLSNRALAAARRSNIHGQEWETAVAALVLEDRARDRATVFQQIREVLADE